MRVVWLLSTLLLTLLGLSASRPSVDQGYTHPGTVVDWDTREGLESAWAVAYETNIVESIDDCPVYRNKIQGQKSDTQGNFSLTIPSNVSDYYVQYCLEGYGGRRTHNQNGQTDSRITPDPIRICKKQHSSAETQERRVLQVLKESESGRIDKVAAQEELSYLREVDREGYDAAVIKNTVMLTRVKASQGPYPPFIVAAREPPQSWTAHIRSFFRAIVNFFR